MGDGHHPPYRDDPQRDAPIRAARRCRPITIMFSEAVNGFDLADLVLTRDGGANLLPDVATLNTSTSTMFTLGNLAGLTAASGHYVLTIVAAGSGITDAAGNALTSERDRRMDDGRDDADGDDHGGDARSAELGRQFDHDRLQRARDGAGSRRPETAARRRGRLAHQLSDSDVQRQHHMDGAEPRRTDRGGGVRTC